MPGRPTVQRAMAAPDVHAVPAIRPLRTDEDPAARPRVESAWQRHADVGGLFFCHGAPAWSGSPHAPDCAIRVSEFPSGPRHGVTVGPANTGREPPRLPRLGLFRSG